MKKLTLLFGLALIIQAIAFSQPCLPEGIIFTTQAQIDSFQVIYPNCTEIEGDMIIGDNSGTNITNLDALSVLISVGGNVSIYRNDSLPSLTGLNELTNIGGQLSIGKFIYNWFFGNDSLTNLIGLDNLNSIGEGIYILGNQNLLSLSGIGNLGAIGGTLSIQANYSLTSLLGLDNLTSIGDEGSLEIINNYSLTSLSDLDNLTSIGWNLWIEDNDALTSLSGLDNVDSIGWNLLIEDNDALTSLSGLGILSTIGGAWLRIQGNDELNTLTVLYNLTSFDGNLWIEDNLSLGSLTGLDNIESGTISSLNIFDNNLLATCEVQSVCDYLSAPSGSVNIHDNATGCNSQEEVEEACEALVVQENDFNAEFSIHPNPATNKIFITSKNGLKIETANIYNQLGQKILHRNELIENIDISTLGQGIYIIELTSSELKIRQKLIIEK